MNGASTSRESVWLQGLDKELLEQIDGLAKAAGTTRSEIIRLSIGLGVALMRKKGGGP